MADENKKIIFQIEIDQSKSLTEIVALKDRIAKLKTEQKELNTTTLEGKKQYEAYNASIKSLTKEQKALENQVEKTVTALDAEEGSIARNRAELSKLTAEYLKTGKPTKEQTDRIKALSDRLKEQESAIGDNRRNVGNYRESILELSNSTGLFGSQVGAINQGFVGLKGGLSTAVKGFGTLKGAIISTGIGALIVALISLIQYFTTTDTGATQLAGIMGGLGEVVRRITGFFAGLGKAIVDLSSGTKDLGDTLEGIGDAILKNITNRLKAPLVLLEALTDAFNELSENGLDANLTPALKKAADGIIQLNTGIEGGTDIIADFSQEIFDAAKAAYDYAVALDDIEDRQRDLNVELAKSNQIQEVLQKQARNRTLSEEQRITILQKASAIEEASTQKQIALDRERLALIEQRNARELANINQQNAALLEELKLAETTAARKIEIQTELLAINDELAQEEADLRVKIINEETAFLKLREKNQGTIDALREAALEKARKAEEERLELLRRVAESEATLETQRLEIKLRNIDIEIQAEEAGSERRKALIERRAELEKQINRELLDAKLNDQNLLEAQRIALIEEFAQKEIEIENKKNSELDKIKAVQKAKEEKDAADKKKALQDTFNSIASISQTVVGSISKVIQADSDAVLGQIEDDRKRALEKAGDDREKQEKVNKKFDKLAEAERKRAAKKQATIQQTQAFINTALAVTQALASSPPPLSFILAGITAAAGAIEIAAIEGQKSRLKKGGIVQGPSHEAGGVTGTGAFNNIEVEGGEYVVNKQATKRFRPVLDSINYGNRLPMRQPVARMADGGILRDGGFFARSTGGVEQQRFQSNQELAQLISEMPNPVVYVSDIDTAKARKVIPQDRANI